MLSHVTFWVCFLVLVSTSSTEQVTLESNVLKTRNVAHTFMQNPTIFDFFLVAPHSSYSSVIIKENIFTPPRFFVFSVASVVRGPSFSTTLLAFCHSGKKTKIIGESASSLSEPRDRREVGFRLLKKSGLPLVQMSRISM